MPANARAFVGGSRLRDIITKELPAAITSHKDKRLDVLGAELFYFYIQANEALIRSEEILNSLDTTCAKISRSIKDRY
jgi:hypothetical protein